MKLNRIAAVLGLALVLAGCAHTVVVPAPAGQDIPGFFHGLFQGYIVVFSFIGSLFNPDIAIYSVVNNGGWYDFGFILGLGSVGGSASSVRR